jgi:dTDP-4-amino-4,6-dideoxygalactose transaminase
MTRHSVETVCKVPFHVPSIGDEEILEVEATLRSGWLTTGPRTQQFEKEFAEYVGAPYVLAVNSGTAGLHLALAGLEIGAGDEVVTTPLTFCATVNTIIHVGAKPVLADVGSDGNLDPYEVARRLTSRTRAILPVHLAGLPCDMEAIWALARQHGLLVVEDAAHAVGSHYFGHPIGTAKPDTQHHSDAVVFSFYATKNLTTGEGGMVTTPHESLASAMRMLSLHGISKDAWSRYGMDGNWYYEVLACGFKYNITDIQSAIGLHQLRKLERLIEIRTQYAHLYQQAFSDMAELEVPPDYPWCRHSWHLYILRLNLEKLTIDRNQFIKELRAKGIGASVHFMPIPLHPYYAQNTSLAHYPCPRALELYPRIVSLPLYPAMTEEQVRYVTASVKEIVYSAKRTHSVGSF